MGPLVPAATPKVFDSSEFQQSGIVHRDVVTKDYNQAISLLPGKQPSVEGDTPFRIGGAALFRMRMWGAATDNTKTCAFTLHAWPHDGRTVDNEPYKGAGILLASITVKFEGPSFPEVHPIHGEATPGVTWFEMSEVSATTYNISANAVKTLIGGTGFAMPILVDALGFGTLWVEPVTAAAVSRIAVEITRMS